MVAGKNDSVDNHEQDLYHNSQLHAFDVVQKSQSHIVQSQMNGVCGHERHSLAGQSWLVELQAVRAEMWLTNGGRLHKLLISKSL